MDNNKLKKFAAEARVQLKSGVTLMLSRMGFDADGQPAFFPEKIDGGTLFMDKIIADESFYYKWHSLYKAIKLHGVKEIYEEVAYTWFNRFMAIRIMRKNGFITPVLEYQSAEIRIPQIVVDARRGKVPPMNDIERQKLNDLLLDDSKTAEQFAILIVAYCQTNQVLSKCFGRINDYTELLLPNNILAQGGFVDMINDTPFISDDDYKHSELIGWLYQFYISEKKDEVFAAFKGGKKAEAEDIPAATQIFTPNWIVKYMVQNTLGRIYLDNNPSSDLAKDWKYLVPEAKGSENAPKLKIKELEELSLIDPGCGSGHILSEAFDMLYEMYLAEYASPREACVAILTKNLVGIDIDTRAKQLSQFSILMKACQKDDSFLNAEILPRIYDMPEPYDESQDTLYDTLLHFFVGGKKQAIEETTDAIRLMDQAKNLGSIMKFDISEKTRFQIERRLVEIRREDRINETLELLGRYFNVILALTAKYTAVVANPPYMGSNNMNSGLCMYVRDNYPDSKADLFSVFMDIASSCLFKNGKYSMINMHNWMFLSSFENLRCKILDNYHIDSMIHLGPRTFDELSGEVVQNTAFVITNCTNSNAIGNYFRLVDGKNCHEKEHMFLNPYEQTNKIFYPSINQSNFESIPGRLIGYWVSSNVAMSYKDNPPIGNTILPRHGLATSDNARFVRYWYEIDNNKSACIDKCNFQKKWYPMNKGGEYRKWFGNNYWVINYENNGFELKKLATELYKSASRTIQNTQFYFREGITWSALTGNKLSFRYTEKGAIFGSGAHCAFAEDLDDLYFGLGIMNSKVNNLYLDIVSPTLNKNVDDIRSTPFIKYEIEEVNRSVEASISISKSDWNAHETSWNFQENELIRLKNLGFGQSSTAWGNDFSSDAICSLPLLVEEYKAHWNTQFRELRSNEEKLNRQFIEIYGLQDELTPDVSLDEVTILQQGEISIVDNEIQWHDNVIMQQFISYIIGCCMGRYRLDRPGLHIAHPLPTDEELAPYSYNGCQFLIDEDGLLPLLPSDSPFQDNGLNLVRDAIKNVFGDGSYTNNLNYVDDCLGKPLEDYLCKDFWNDHKKMYQNRPIYWFFSSNKGAFKVIAYAHRMTKYTVELVRRKYLQPYLEYLIGRADELQSKDFNMTAYERKTLQNFLKLIDECKEYDERLHAVAEKYIEFDLDDGILHNYALYGDVLAKIK